MLDEDKLRPVFATGIEAARLANQTKEVIAYILGGTESMLQKYKLGI
jgi:hypothetical protein